MRANPNPAQPAASLKLYTKLKYNPLILVVVKVKLDKNVLLRSGSRTQQIF